MSEGLEKQSLVEQIADALDFAIASKREIARCDACAPEKKKANRQKLIIDREDEESPARVCIHKAEYPKGRHYGQCFCLDCMLATCINYDFSNGG